MENIKDFLFNIQLFGDITLSKVGDSLISGSVSIGSTSGAGAVGNPYTFTWSAVAEGTSASAVAVTGATWFSMGEADSGLKIAGLTDGYDLTLARGAEETQKVAVSISGNSLAWVGLTGTMSFTLGSDSTFTQKINDSQFSLTGAVANTKIALDGADDGSSIEGASLTAGGVTFDAINQAWNIGSGASFAFNGTSIAVSNSDVTLASGTSIALTMAAGGSLAIAGARDSLSVDGMSISGEGLGQLAEIVEDQAYVIKGDSNGGMIKVNGSEVNVAADSDVMVTGSGSTAYISQVAGLSSTGGFWKLGKASEVTLGETNWSFSTANAILEGSSNTAQSATYEGTATMQGNGASFAETALVANGVDWKFTNASLAAFDEEGNITDFGATAGGSVAFASSTPVASLASFAINGKDTLSLVNATVGVADSVVSYVTGSLEADSDWSVAGTEVNFNDTTFNFGTPNTGVLNMDSTGAAVDDVTASKGVTIGSQAASGTSLTEGFQMTVNGAAWSIAGDADGSLGFDADGNASVNYGGANAVSVVGASDMTVTTAASSTSIVGSFNGASASIVGDADTVGVVLEDVADGAGIATITGLDNGAVVDVADTSFVATTSKATVTVASSNESSITSFDVGEKGDQLNVTLGNGEGFTVQGAKAVFEIGSAADGDIDYSTADGDIVTINGVAATIKSGNSGTASIGTDNTGGVTGVTMTAGDALYTNGDTDFTVVVQASDEVGGDDGNTIITINDTQITIPSSLLTADDADTSLKVAVDSDGVASVAVSGGLASIKGDITVSEGVWNIGGSTATIEGETGTVKLSGTGKATVEASSVAEYKAAQSEAVTELRNDPDKNDATAFQAYLGNWDGITADKSSATLNFADAEDTEPTEAIQTTGINLIGNAAFSSAKLTDVTVQAYSGESTALVIDGDTENGIKRAVLDFSGSKSTHQIYIADSDVAHTVLGGNEGDTIIFGGGDDVRAANYAEAGTGNTYLQHTEKSNTKKLAASLIGNSGDDTIIGAENDYIVGGAGKDYFGDNAAVLVTDYTVDDEDVIVANKLTANGITNRNQLVLSDNTIQINNGSKITLGSEYDGESSMAAIITGIDGNTKNAKYVAWASDAGSEVDASSRTAGAYVIGDNNKAADFLTGGSGKDSIYAGAGDSVNSGEGADYIVLNDTIGNDLGAMVALTSGKNTVKGWSSGFDNEESGNTILYYDGGLSNLSFKNKNGDLVVSDSSGSLTIDDAGNAAKLLIGTSADADELTKVQFIQKNGAVTINADSLAADYYYAEKSGRITFGPGLEETDLGLIELGGETYQNIARINDYSNSKTSIAGAEGSVKETVTASGALEEDAHKVVSLGGGNDVIISGGNTTVENNMTAGNTFYFSAGDGKDTIRNFAFYQGAEIDPSGDEADTVVLNSFAGVKGNDTKVELATSDSDKVVIARGASTIDDIMRLDIGGAIYNAKVGKTSGTNNFKYTSDADVYYGNGDKDKDTITAATASDEAVSIWLDGSDGNLYEGIGYLNASGLTDSTATLVGAVGTNTTIQAAAKGSQTSLWGGVGGSNKLIGGAGEDTFVFLKGYGNNDTISGYSTDDLVWLMDTNLDDLDLDKMAAFDSSFGITNKEIRLYYKDGSELHIASPSTSTSVKLADGTTYTATNRGSNRSWGV